jgi:selenocysteine-specific elongation factor
MPYIIGTAGHIDHGKTSLIKALTGEDTDRLKEEKERGISIDLGFAHLDLPNGTRAGIVDVPGHERFIRNMLAGAHGIDLALFTVAADDGVMPQTEEHLDILHLLGVHRAIFVITKTDLVPEARVSEVMEDIRILTAGTSLEDSPMLPFSFVSGKGLDELRRSIAAILERGDKSPPSGYFRLPVDRVFALQGHGLIVTGTAQSGEVRAGDRLRSLPENQSFRVRSVQVHNQPTEVGVWGQRIALNLSGQEAPSIQRGSVICHESITRTSDRFDAFVEVRPAAANGLKNHQRVRIHAGTAERMGKLILLGSREKAQPKESVYCQIVLSEPVLAMRGDRFVVRDETSSRTLAGGSIIHPWAAKHKRTDPDLQQKLQLLHHGEHAQLAAALIDENPEFALSIAPIYEFLNLTEEHARNEISRAATIRVLTLEGERLYTTEAKLQRVREELLHQLRDYHTANPLAPGMDMELVRDKVPYDAPPRVFRALVDQFEMDRLIARDGNLLRLPDHKVRVKDEERTLMENIKAILAKTPLAPPDLKEIETALRMSRSKLNEVLRVMEREKSVVRVSMEMYFLAETIDSMKKKLREYLSTNSQITPANFRDLFQSTRKYTIPLLEYFDREGVTIRVGDIRKLKSAPTAGTKS